MAYRDVILADSPVGYWRLGEASGTTAANEVTGNAGTYAGGPTLGVAGALAGDANTAVTLDGVNDAMSVALNLTGTKTVTLEFWIKAAAWVDGNVLAEFTPNYNNANGFIVSQYALTANTLYVGMHEATSYNTGSIPRPSTGAWHHFVVVYDKAQTGAAQLKVYVDKVAQTVTVDTATTLSDFFANSTLYLGGRGGTQFNSAASFDELAVYSGALTSTQVAAHYDAAAAALTAVAATVREPLDLQQSVTAQTREPLDLRAQVGQATREVYDLAGSVAGLTREPLDVLIVTGATVREPLDVLNAVGAQIREPLDVAQIVAVTTREPYDMAGLVSASSREPYDVLATIAALSREPYDVLTVVARSVAEPLDLWGLVGALVREPFAGHQPTGFPFAVIFVQHLPRMSTTAQVGVRVRLATDLEARTPITQGNI